MKKLLVGLILVSLLLLPAQGVSARTAEEIQNDINEQQKQLDDLNKQLAQANKDRDSSKSKVASSQSEISKVKSTLEEIDAQLKVNELEKQQLEQQIALSDLQKAQKEKEQDKQIFETYLNWKTDDFSKKIFSTDEDVLKSVVYLEFMADTSENSIMTISEQIDNLNQQNEDNKSKQADLEKQMASLNEQKKTLEDQINALNQAIARANSNADKVRSKTAGVQQTIAELTAEQKAIQQADDNITSGGSGGSEPVQTGELYFTGTGRDLYQGHGVGMSQFGAYGAAYHGWTAHQIVTFYYTNTHIESRPGLNVSVSGYGTMSMENYVSGLGEVPSKACGTLDQINQYNAYADSQGWAPDDPRRSKYVLDNPNTVWDCWPEESIKAQVIAARSYAGSYGGTICTTASCQVYVGGNAKAWAAWETRDQYIISNGSTHNGQIIRALYSSDNNQGYGTADNDTVFSSFSGVGTPYSYLRHVNDNSVAASWTYTHWGWRTNGYTMAHIDQMFAWASVNYNTGGAHSFLSSLKNSVGTVNSLSFVRDGSNRVKYVRVNGSSGSANIAGWLFKAVWNDWVYNVRPSGQTDYIYSTTFFLQTQ